MEAVTYKKISVLEIIAICDSRHPVPSSIFTKIKLQGKVIKLEKRISNFSIFENYHDRQVVLNYYEDEDFLWKRDGFHFDKIQFLNGVLLFTKKDGKTFSISIKDYETVSLNTDFQNYFMLRKGCDRMEMYFPN